MHTPPRLSIDVSVELLLRASANGAVPGGVGDACQDEPAGHLIVVEETLVRLVRVAPSLHLPCASAAGASAAGVRQVQAGVFRGVKNVLVVCTLDHLLVPSHIQ